jgi:hypothetical protein
MNQIPFKDVATGQKFFCPVMGGFMVKKNDEDAIYHCSHPRHAVHPFEPWYYNEEERERLVTVE